MRVVETLLDGGGYEQRFGFRLGGLPLRFVRRPVSILPAEGTVCMVDAGPRLGSIGKQDGAVFKDGKWCRTKLEPTHWTMPDD